MYVAMSDDSKSGSGTSHASKRVLRASFDGQQEYSRKLCCSLAEPHLLFCTIYICVYVHVLRLQEHNTDSNIQVNETFFELKRDL